jgi:hypothetical protein
VVPYLCFRFRIFYTPTSDKYIFQVKRGPHLLQSCLHLMQNGLSLTLREMHTSFESLAVTNAPSLQASLMDIHHDTSLKSILEDDYISLTSKTHIRLYSHKGARLWLVIRPSIHSFHIAHSIFTLTLCFCLGFIQPSHLVFSRVSVNTGWTHLART